MKNIHERKNTLARAVQSFLGTTLLLAGLVANAAEEFYLSNSVRPFVVAQPNTVRGTNTEMVAEEAVNPSVPVAGAASEVFRFKTADCG